MAEDRALEIRPACQDLFLMTASTAKQGRSKPARHFALYPRYRDSAIWNSYNRQTISHV